jgi:two-component system NarL family response regulator/two-component system response regulator DevR
MQRQRDVFVVDEHAGVRQALVAWLAARPGLRVVGDTGDLEQALLQVAASHPDIIIVEPKRPDGLGLALVERLAHLPWRPRVIVLTSYASDWERYQSQQWGATAYVLKDLGSGALGRELQRAVA